jgi:hypothetical protein
MAKAKKKATKKGKIDPALVPKYNTTAQVGSSVGGGSTRAGVATLTSQTPPGLPNETRTFDLMLKDPTIKLAIDIIVAMMTRQPWSVVAKEDGDEQYASDMLQQLNQFKEIFIRSALRGCLRDGWRAFEVAYSDDQASLIGVKPLRTLNTKPLVYEDTGAFAGVLNRGSGTGTEEVDIDEQHCVFVNFDDEGYGDLGIPLLRTAYLPYNKWEEADSGARRYDQKIAGGFLLIQYPTGSSPYSGLSGADTNNEVIADNMGQSFQAVGYACVPVVVDPDTGEPVDNPWKIEHISAGGGMQGGFIERLKYLDALKLRAFGIPERSTTEGTFGTKAESEQHADIAFMINSDRHNRIAQAIDECVVRTLNLANKSDPYACKLLVGKLDPADRELFATLFSTLMTDPVLGETIASRVDTDTLLEKLNIPVRADAADEAPGTRVLEDDSPAPTEKITDKKLLKAI